MSEFGRAFALLPGMLLLCSIVLIATAASIPSIQGESYQQGRADALTAVRAQQQAATVALKDAKQIREASITAVVLAADALRVCSGEEGK